MGNGSAADGPKIVLDYVVQFTKIIEQYQKRAAEAVGTLEALALSVDMYPDQGKAAMGAFEARLPPPLGAVIFMWIESGMFEKNSTGWKRLRSHDHAVRYRLHSAAKMLTGYVLNELTSRQKVEVGEAFLNAMLAITEGRASRMQEMAAAYEEGEDLF